MKLNETYVLIVFLLLFPFLTVSTVMAQSMCDCNGNGGIACEIKISSQADLDALALDNCTTITGSLAINSPDLTNLNGLESIEAINYNLIIYNNLLLTDLDGLTNLRMVGWNLKIIENDVLASIAGLDNLIVIAGDKIEIAWNPSLDDLTPLYGTDVIGDYLRIQNNQILSMAEAFSLLIQLSPPNGIFNGSSLITDNGSGIADTDGDGIPDPDDICPNDALNDADGDGYCADEDNCPLHCNILQSDADGDGEGDVCQAGSKKFEKGCSDGCGSPTCEQEC